MPSVRPFAILVETGGLLGFFPYRWDFQKNVMTFRPSWIWRLTHALWYSLLTTYAIFLMYRAHQVYTDPAATNSDRSQSMYMSFLHVGLNVGFLMDLQGWGEHHIFYNQLLEYAAKFKRQHGADMNTKLMERLLGINLFGWFFVTTHAFAVFRAPGSKLLLTSLLSKETQSNILVKITFFLIHALIKFSQFFYMDFNSMTLICYNFLLVPVAERLKWQDNVWGTGPNRYRQLTPLQIHKHSLQIAILQSKYTVAYGPWLLLIIVWCIIIIALNIFQVVAFQQLRSLIASIFLSILLASVSKNAGRLFERAQDAKDSWRGIRSVNWFPRYVRAYRPARVPLGSFFYFDRGIWPTIYNIILGQAANMIVSYKEE